MISCVPQIKLSTESIILVVDGPYAIGFIHEYSGSFTGGSMSLVACLLTAAGLLMTLRKAGKDVPEVVAVASVPLQER